MAQLVDEIDYESLPAQEKLYVHLAAGAAAGIMEHCAMFPIDTVKVRGCGGTAEGAVCNALTTSNCAILFSSIVTLIRISSF